MVTDQNINFSEGIGIVNASSIAETYSKTVQNAIVQLKNANATVITSATVSDNTVTIRCRNLTGTGFTGQVAATVLLFMS